MVQLRFPAANSCKKDRESVHRRPRLFELRTIAIYCGKAAHREYQSRRSGLQKNRTKRLPETPRPSYSPRRPKRSPGRFACRRPRAHSRPRFRSLRYRAGYPRSSPSGSPRRMRLHRPRRSHTAHPNGFHFRAVREIVRARRVRPRPEPHGLHAVVPPPAVHPKSRLGCTKAKEAGIILKAG